MKDGTRISDYEYDLPPGRIARYPTERRDHSRLLVVPGEGGPLAHRRFTDLVDLLNPGDVLVVNESRVALARLLGRKPTGAPSEILLLRPWAGETEPSEGEARAAHDEATLWEALVRPGGKLKPGRVVNIAPGFDVEVVDSAPGGGRVVRLVVEGSVRETLEKHGHVPLPPYLEREDEPLDRERYQTVYARVPGSVAAPTAGLHFTPDLLDKIDAKGVRRGRSSWTWVWGRSGRSRRTIQPSTTSTASGTSCPPRRLGRSPPHGRRGGASGRWARPWCARSRVRPEMGWWGREPE